MILIIFLASVVALSVATSLDVIWTDRGLRAGVAVEGNKLEVKLFGLRPSLRQLVVFNVVETALVIAPSFAGLVLGNVSLAIGGLGVIVANAARHYFKGYKAWKKLLS